jgi:hypothetical protein
MEPLPINLDAEALTLSPKDKDPHGGLDFAWRVHAALDSWTGKVDTKASITVAIESASLGFVLTLSKKGERLSGLHGLSEVLYKIGVCSLVGALVFALFVVMPQLKRRQARRNWHRGMIYFGHLRHWDPTELASRLKSRQDYEVHLADQLVVMSKVVWRKHARLQWSVWLLALAVVSLALAALKS